MREPEYCTDHGLGAYYCGECVGQHVARAEAAEARVAELEAALKPFAIDGCCEEYVETCSSCVAGRVLRGAPTPAPRTEAKSFRVCQLVTIGSGNPALVEFHHRVGEVCDEHIGEVQVWIRGESKAGWFPREDVYALPRGVTLTADVQRFENRGARSEQSPARIVIDGLKAANAALADVQRRLDGTGPKSIPADVRPNDALAVVIDAANATSWPLPAMVHRLANAAQYLMAAKSCDAHGWEGVTYAIGAARAFLEALPPGTVPVGADGKPWMPAEGTCAGNPEDGPGNPATPEEARADAKRAAFSGAVAVCQRVAKMFEASGDVGRAGGAHRCANELLETRSDSLKSSAHPDVPRVMKLLVQRVGGAVTMTEHDLQRADRYQLRWLSNGHTLSVAAVDDT